MINDTDKIGENVNKLAEVCCSIRDNQDKAISATYNLQSNLKSQIEVYEKIILQATIIQNIKNKINKLPGPKMGGYKSELELSEIFTENLFIESKIENDLNDKIDFFDAEHATIEKDLQELDIILEELYKIKSKNIKIFEKHTEGVISESMLDAIKNYQRLLANYDEIIYEKGEQYEHLQECVKTLKEDKECIKTFYLKTLVGDYCQKDYKDEEKVYTITSGRVNICTDKKDVQKLEKMKKMENIKKIDKTQEEKDEEEFEKYIDQQYVQDKIKYASIGIKYIKRRKPAHKIKNTTALVEKEKEYDEDENVVEEVIIEDEEEKDSKYLTDVSSEHSLEDIKNTENIITSVKNVDDIVDTHEMHENAPCADAQYNWSPPQQYSTQSQIIYDKNTNFNEVLESFKLE